MEGMKATSIIKLPTQAPDLSPPYEKTRLKKEILALLEKKKGILVAHYYVDDDIQELAEESGGIVSDSLEMARFCHESPAEMIVVAGVRFMGETAKILNPQKKVIMPDLEAECSLDLLCPADRFIPFCDEHPKRIVVVYSNTSAEVKARADYVVTSSIAVPLVTYLHEQNHKIIWAPDKNLGEYIKNQTGADMLLWNGSCVVHDEFKAVELREMKRRYPDAAILVHPESPMSIIEQADVVGSTTQIIEAAKKLPHQRLIVATDNGIFHQIKKQVPEKVIMEAPTAGRGASCKSCSHCPWMAMNTLKKLKIIIDSEQNQITVEESVRIKAYRATKRMLEFANKIKKPTLDDA